jgi:decaprenyl-phosphate phosphoribosyltransferase
VKNLLVFAVPFAAGRIFDPAVFASATAAAVAFVMASSSTYLINDAGDAEADRRHPTKRFRPIAAGQITPCQARRVAASLLVGAVAVAAAITPAVAALVVTYLAITSAYSRWLKHIPLVDSIAVASGFVIRAATGAAATGIAITPVFFTIAAAGSMFIVVGKRLGEVLLLGPAAPTHRRVLGWYTPQRCRRLLAGSLTCTVAAFALWAVGAADPGSPSALNSGSVSVASLTIIPFVLAAARGWQLIRAGGGGDPLRLLTHDRVLPAFGLLTMMMVSAAIYR